MNGLIFYILTLILVPLLLLFFLILDNKRREYFTQRTLLNKILILAVQLNWKMPENENRTSEILELAEKHFSPKVFEEFKKTVVK